jgi:hypothetical protein
MKTRSFFHLSLPIFVQVLISIFYCVQGWYWQASLSILLISIIFWRNHPLFSFVAGLAYSVFSFIMINQYVDTYDEQVFRINVANLFICLCFITHPTIGIKPAVNRKRLKDKLSSS